MLISYITLYILSFFVISKFELIDSSILNKTDISSSYTNNESNIHDITDHNLQKLDIYSTKMNLSKQINQKIPSKKTSSTKNNTKIDKTRKRFNKSSKIIQNNKLHLSLDNLTLNHSNLVKSHTNTSLSILKRNKTDSIKKLNSSRGYLNNITNITQQSIFNTPTFTFPSWHKQYTYTTTSSWNRNNTDSFDDWNSTKDHSNYIQYTTKIPSVNYSIFNSPKYFNNHTIEYTSTTRRNATDPINYLNSTRKYSNKISNITSQSIYNYSTFDSPNWFNNNTYTTSSLNRNNTDSFDNWNSTNTHSNDKRKARKRNQRNYSKNIRNITIQPSYNYSNSKSINSFKNYSNTSSYNFNINTTISFNTTNSTIYHSKKQYKNRLKGIHKTNATTKNYQIPQINRRNSSSKKNSTNIYQDFSNIKRNIDYNLSSNISQSLNNTRFRKKKMSRN